MTRPTAHAKPPVLTALDGTEHEPQGWLIARLRAHLPVAHRIDPAAQLVEYGLDSVVALGLYGEIEETFGVMLEPGAIYDCATVRELARHLVDRAALRRPGRERS
ncbi:acyl carrier protein [Kitasatospora sp. NPDC089797]|uniref:acyl carrier protein n=1 Tax=Kitasatospora sp. NPDC089797 TaxID=3155298 RepID=UPI00341838DC